MQSIRALSVFAVAALLLMIGATAADAARRLALVVGNSAYSSANPLPNAAADAIAFADLLQRNGFEVVRLTDVTRVDFALGLARFAEKIEAGDTALFYFAGHGIQLRGENFLLGLDARLESEFAVAGEAISLDSIIGLMERKAAVSILFVDACRNNPLADRLNREINGVTRGAPAQGLAPVEAVGNDTMVAFAATPGQVAYDGGAGNSPFTKALLEHLATPSLEIGSAFKRVVREVRERTGNQQSPQLVTNLATEIYINPRVSISSADEPLKPALDIQPADGIGDDAAAQEPSRLPRENQELALELALWNLVKDSDEPREVESYLERFPSGTFAELARERLRGIAAEPLVPSAQPPEAASDDRDLVVQLQRELARVGCSPGAADGIWGRRTRTAFETFSRLAGLSLPAQQPEPTMLEALGQFTTRVCPLTCSARQHAVDGRCVQKTCSTGKQLNSQGKCITPTRQAVRSTRPPPERKVSCRLETRDECRARARAAGAIRGSGFCRSSNRRQICG